MSGKGQLERFVSEYSDRAYLFARKLCGDSELAKELVQEAFFRVFRKWDKYDPSRPLEGWYCTILKNVYFDSLKRYERKHGVALDAPLSSDGEGGTLSDLLADSREETIISRLERQELSAEVRAALNALKADYRAILILSDIEGMCYEEIAAVLECPLGTVRSRLSRARTALRSFILDSTGEMVGAK